MQTTTTTRRAVLATTPAFIATTVTGRAAVNPTSADPAFAVVEQFLAASRAYDKVLERDDTPGEASRGERDAAMKAAWAAERALFSEKPTTILGVVAMLEALAMNDTTESPIEWAINGDDGEMVNDYLRLLAAVLRSATR
jgi:hypothetical protein